jgi:DNA-binding transcriptional regulator YhcF (GntR family)
VAQRSGTSGPKYRQIADDLRTRIESGEYPPGSQLPTKAELMTRHHVALNTVERAIEELRKAGIVETVQGSGMFTREPPADGMPPSADPAARRLAALESEVAGIRTGLGEMRETIARLQAQLITIYELTGNSYPPEAIGAAEWHTRAAEGRG